MYSYKDTTFTDEVQISLTYSTRLLEYLPNESLKKDHTRQEDRKRY